MKMINKGQLTKFVVALIALACSNLVSHAYAESTSALAGYSGGLPPVPFGQLPASGTFWRVQNSFPTIVPPSPRPPLDPNLPVYALPNGHFLVDHTGGLAPQQAGVELMNFIVQSQEFMLSTESTFAASPAGSMESGGVSAMGGIFTNAPETLLFDTMSSSSNGLLASWRDVRPSPVPHGMTLGILIATNCPFEITRIETEVVFENPESLPDTEIEVGFFRGTNQFQYAMYVDPEYAVSDVEGTLTRTLTNMGNGRWLLSLELPTYAWGTNRLVTIRTIPSSDGTMAKMSFIASDATIPGITAYHSDNTTTNMVPVALPKMQVWRRELSPTRAVSYETFLTDLDLTWLPGYQLGNTTNLLSAWTWQTDGLRNWTTTIDTREGTRFFLTRPDPTE